jgi:serine/threonine protein phosphatase PrpC
MDSIREGVLKTDRDFLEWATANDVYSGCTVVGAFLQDRRLTVLNVGDSRAVLCRAGEAFAMSTDHKPDRPDEKSRIECAGGSVLANRELNMMKLHQINPRIIEEMNIPQRLAEFVGYINVYRIMGELATSRSLGDAEYKGVKQEEFWKQKFSADLVISEPEIVEVTLGDEDDFLVLACDGLWDVMSNQEAVDFVSAEYLRASSAEKIARRLVKEAMRLGSQDNITVIIVFFKE